MKTVILFICTANICRSPMAEGLFRDKARRAGDSELFEVQSAGTWAIEQQPASSNALIVLAQRGIDLSAHRSKMVTRCEMDAAAVVIVMTRSHREALAAEFPFHRPKIHLMSELGCRVYDIGDPYGGTLDEYESTARQLQSLIEDGYEKIKLWTSNIAAPIS